MKQFLCGILVLACLAGLTACGGKEEAPISVTAKDDEFIVTVVCDNKEVDQVGYSAYIGGAYRTMGGGMEIDSKQTDRCSLDFHFSGDDFQDGDDISQFSMELSLYVQGGKEEIKVAEPVSIAAEYGKTYTIDLSGDREKGFSANLRDASQEAAIQEQFHIYKTQVQYTGENDPVQYLEIASRSAQLLAELEDKAGAFVADFYNYQAMDENGTPLYTMNGMKFAEEIDPNGHCIRVSRNYFAHNPIETVDGSDLTKQLVYDDLTLNLLVPEKYRDMEEDIITAHQDRFYFEKVEAENDYNQEAGVNDRINIAKENLKINIIYVKDGQDYDSFRSDCAQQTGCKVEDPIVQIYTGNIHCNYAHSFMSQWVYVPSEAENAGEAYQEISTIIRSCGAEESVQKLIASAIENSQS